MAKKKLTHQEVKRTLEAAGIDFRKDVFELPVSSLNLVADMAKLSGYRRSASANGSTGRMYFEYLSRLGASHTSRTGKTIEGFEFHVDDGHHAFWTQLQGSGGQMGAGSLHAVRALPPSSKRIKELCAKLLHAARAELQHTGKIRVYRDHETPGQRIRAVAATAIHACRPIVGRSF